MAKSPAYQHYASDFSMKTRAWSLSEIGAFIRLLDYQWCEGAVPPDKESIQRIVGGDASQRVLGQFSMTPDGLKNREMEDQRERQKSYRTRKMMEKRALRSGDIVATNGRLTGDRKAT